MIYFELRLKTASLDVWNGFSLFMRWQWTLVWWATIQYVSVAQGIRCFCAISFGILALFSVYLLHKIYGAQNGAYQGLGTPRKTEENIALQARKPDTSCCGQSVRLFPVSQTNIARPCIWHPSPGHTLRHCGLHARNSEFSFYFSYTLEWEICISRENATDILRCHTKFVGDVWTTETICLHVVNDWQGNPAWPF